MRKTIFFTSIVLAFILLISIVDILITDFDRLTQYGYGYLFGKILLFALLGTVTFFSRNKETKSTQEA